MASDPNTAPKPERRADPAVLHEIEANTRETAEAVKADEARTAILEGIEQNTRETVGAVTQVIEAQDDVARTAILQGIEANTKVTADAVTTISPEVHAAAAAVTATAAETAAALVAATATAAADVASAKRDDTRRASDAAGGAATTKTVTQSVQRVVLPSGQVVAAPTSTEEEDRMTAGQRQINLLWEKTQRQISLFVIGAAVLVAAYLAILGDTDAKTGAAVFMYGAANLISGFYFGRTNHQKVGGVQTR